MQRFDYVTIVSGLPRSGTSMMMKMLEAGGMEVKVDNIRKADEDNPKGYYEFEEVKRIKEDVSCLDGLEGKTVKMVSMLLYDLPQNKNYKVIFMKRHMDEVLASQKVMLERKGIRDEMKDKQMGELFSKHLKEIEKWLTEQGNIDVLYVNYSDAVKNPLDNVHMIDSFLGNRLDIEKMVNVVDRTLYRQKSAQYNILTSADKKDTHNSFQKDQDKEKIEEQLRALGYM